jgi:hypothetical protein
MERGMETETEIEIKPEGVRRKGPPARCGFLHAACHLLFPFVFVFVQVQATSKLKLKLS